VLLVLPASRAGRRLTELLAEHFDGTPWTPPAVTTLNGLPTHLCDDAPGTAEPVLDPLAARWIRATGLRTADRATLEAVVPRPPGPDDWRGWLALARQLGRLDDELAGARLTAADVPGQAANAGIDLGMSDTRWAAIAALQQAYDTQRGDRHDEASMLRAAGSGAAALGPAAKRPVVLVGLVDVPPAFAALIDRCDDVTVLSPVPAAHAAGLGAAGQLRPGYWDTQAVAAPEPTVCDRPADQAAAATQAAATGLAQANQTSIAGSFDRLTVALGDEQAAGSVRRALESAGATVREAAGRPALASGPGQLLAALGRYANGRGIEALAELTRHPDLYPGLEQPLDDLNPELPAGEYRVARGIAGFDEQRRTHAPARVAGPLPKRAYALGAARTRADALLPDGPDAASARRPWPAWSNDLLSLLQEVYADRTLSRRDDHDLIEAMSALADVLNEQIALDAAQDAGITLPQAIDLTLARFAEARLPEPGGAGAAEMLGFLEVALDDAPALVMVDVNEGRIPEARSTSDAFLPDGLRRALGLRDAASRYARDVVLMNMSLRPRTFAAVLCCRRDDDGTPRMPSRLMLAADDDTVLRRVRAFYGEDSGTKATAGHETATAAAPEVTATTAFALPHPEREPPAPLPERLAVTAFRDYLACPYRFYLGRVLKLRRHEEPLPELDPGRFGDLAHLVMERFGHETALHDCTDADALADYFAQALREEAKHQFGHSAAPAVRVQVARLERRLQNAAVVQAARAAAGWRIVPEWTERAVERQFEADGYAVTVTSKVDRVDRHPELGACVVDYKTSEAAKTPEKQHQKGSKRAGFTWTDLQLPLYRWLLAGKNLPDAAVGYFNLAKNPKLTGVFIANWTDADHQDALTKAREIVQHIGERKFWPPGDPAHFPDGFARICADASPERDVLIAQTGATVVSSTNGGAA